MSEPHKSKLIIRIEYPLMRTIIFYIVMTIIFTILFSKDMTLYPLIVIDLVWTVVYYFHIGVRYKYVDIYNDKLIIMSPVFFFRKKRQFNFEDVDNFFFQEHGSFRDDPYFNINMKVGQKKRIRMPKSELAQIKMHLKDLGTVKIVTSRYADEGLGW